MTESDRDLLVFLAPAIALLLVMAGCVVALVMIQIQRSRNQYQESIARHPELRGVEAYDTSVSMGRFWWAVAHAPGSTMFVSDDGIILSRIRAGRDFEVSIGWASIRSVELVSRFLPYLKIHWEDGDNVKQATLWFSNPASIQQSLLSRIGRIE